MNDELDFMNNYLALFLSICTNMNPSQALAAVEGEEAWDKRISEKLNFNNRKTREDLTEEDFHDMLEMRANVIPYQEIAEKYDIPYSTIYKWIKPYEKKNI